MIDLIITALREKNIDIYRINSSRTETAELFFIKKNLDMRRMKNTELAVVTVYRDFEKDGKKFRGFTEAQIFPDMSKEEIAEKLDSAYYAASFVCNPFFELVSGTAEESVQMQSSLFEHSIEQDAMLVAQALYVADNSQDAFINSAEVFVQKNEQRIITSAGTDVGYSACKVSGEFVVQCVEPDDVEMFHSFAYDTLATDSLTQKAAEAISTVRDRALASKSPSAGKYDVILSGDHVDALLSYYTSRSTAAYVYAGYSSFAKGASAQGESIEGERINITGKAVYPYSDEGIPMTDRAIISDGVVESIYGPTRFCYYLGCEPTGYYTKFSCNNGSIPFADMKQGKRLYIVSFSDFQMDDFSGHFGGEIRLAYLFDGDKTEILTGGSINGSILDCQSKLTFSNERYLSSSFDGPFAVLLRDVNVAGSEG